MSDDFQRGLQARLAHLIGEASQWERGSGAHPPGLVKALSEALEYCCAEIERLRRERDQYKLAAELNKQTIEAMSRGEYICSNCGIRKDGEHDHAVEF
jgi:hypothetical protein